MATLLGGVENAIGNKILKRIHRSALSVLNAKDIFKVGPKKEMEKKEEDNTKIHSAKEKNIIPLQNISKES